MKYYGLEDVQENNKEPRSSFLTDGLFRITQPIFLNDKGSEAKLYPYFNKFSPADYAWARKKSDSVTSINSPPLSDEDLEKLFLKPFGKRYGEVFPHLIALEGEYKTIQEYDEAEFKKIAHDFNKNIMQLLSCRIGIFSLAKSDVNELMWTHYASEGKGIAVTFKKNHLFFLLNQPRDVSYLPEDRATLTYYKGSVRINGEPTNNLIIDPNNGLENILRELQDKGVDYQDLVNRLLYSKKEKWFYENETRIVFDLALSEKHGEIFVPDVDETIRNFLPNHFKSEKEICLNKIPFSAFDSLVFGYDIDENHKQKIIDKVRRNSELEHLRLKQTFYNIYGDLEVEDVLVGV
ncbi:MAG: hypothetical protein ACJARQ_002633 [Oleispira sp.]